MNYTSIIAYIYKRNTVVLVLESDWLSSADVKSSSTLYGDSLYGEDFSVICL